MFLLFRFETHISPAELNKIKYDVGILGSRRNNAGRDANRGLYNSEASPNQERSKVFLHDDARKTISVTIIKLAEEHSTAGQCMSISI